MKRILPTIVISQFFCTSIWFAGNAIVGDIGKNFGLDKGLIAALSSIVQFGFISGTLIFAILSISDRFPPSKIFFACATLAGIFNLTMILTAITPTQLLLARFLTGFLLAGIYPIGMKIAADHFDKSLSKSLGFLVGALVLGTSFPHLLKGLTAIPWQYVVISTSLLSFLGGLAMLTLVPEGPYRKVGQRLLWTAFLKSFQNRKFRSTAIGYFGHNWELYAFWVFLPLILARYQQDHPEQQLNIPVLSFLIIASGGFACVGSGMIASYLGARRTAIFFLSTSMLCCLVSPLVLSTTSLPLLLLFLFVWGMAVVADSPLFSTMIAQYAIPDFKGTSLTIVNCIGFALTIVSIQLINLVYSEANANYVFSLLALGPLVGLFFLIKKKEEV